LQADFEIIARAQDHHAESRGARERAIKTRWWTLMLTVAEKGLASARRRGVPHHVARRQGVVNMKNDGPNGYCGPLGK